MFLRFVGILRTLILWNSLQLASTGCQDSLIKSTQHATRCAIVNQNIVKSKIKFKIYHTFMNGYNYGKFMAIL